MHKLVLMLLFVASAASAQYTKLTGTGICDLGPVSGGLYEPYHISVDGGRLLVADYGNYVASAVVNNIRQPLGVFDSLPTSVIASGGKTYVSTLGKLFVIENNLVRELPHGTGNSIYGITVGGGFLWFVDFNAKQLSRLPLPCNPSCAVEVVTTATDLFPQDVLYKSNTEIYIVDTGRSRIRLYNSVTNMLSVFAGTGTAGLVDGPLLSAQFNYPTGITMTAAGDLVVADTINNRIRRISGGMVSTLSGVINMPNGVAVDEAAQVLYVAVNANGIFKAAWGAATPGVPTATMTQTRLPTSTATATEPKPTCVPECING